MPDRERECNGCGRTERRTKYSPIVTAKGSIAHPVPAMPRICALALLLLLLSSGPARADNLLVNGDLSKGSGNSPEAWRTLAWQKGPDFTTYAWHHSPAVPAELEISSTKPNDAYWTQMVHLAPGWYHFTASIRAQGVSEAAAGANLGIVEDGIISRQLHGTTDWQTVGFYLKVGGQEADVPLACRLGGFANLNTGKAFCRNLSVTKVEAPPENAGFIYYLDEIRGVTRPSEPLLSPSANIVTVLAIIGTLLALGFSGRRQLITEARRMFGGGLSPKPRRTPPAPARERGDEPAHWPEPEATTRAEMRGEALQESQESLVARGEDLSTDHLRALVIVVAVLSVTVLALRRLDGTSHAVNFAAAFAGVRSVVGTTAVAALQLWFFWAVAAAILAGLILQIDSELDLTDAILGGVSGVWAIGYFLGQLLGPIGLFRPLTIWILVAAGMYQLWRRPPRIRIAPMTMGQKLALIALGLLSVGMLPLQLGSPLAPYMDVLSYPASVQRILSFGVYMPFDNDPYGCWGPRAQTPALELFLAVLAMGSHVKLGVLAHSGIMIPMAALIIFATYRLGVTLADDIAGGMAALLLFFDTLFRKMTGMRGTAVDFALIALGLAFLLDRRRSRTLMALGAIILGTSVASHAINGGLAMIIASVGVVLWLADGESGRFMAGVEFLAGAVLFALPELSIGLGRALPYPVLPLMQIAGIAAVVFAMRQGGTVEARRTRLTSWIARALIVVLFAGIIYTHATGRGSIFEQLMDQFPLLFIFALGGLAIWAAWDDAFDFPNGLAIVATALLIGIASQFLKYFAGMGGSEAFGSGVADIGFKVEEYWCPYFMVLAAAIPFALAYHARERTRLVVVLALLTLLIYPWYPRFNVDDNFTEHSIADEWGISLGTAANGFWILTHDSRWTMGPADFALVDYLRAEQARGHISTATHILHIARDATVMGDFNRFSVFTGINDDPILHYIPATDIGWFATSRVRRISQIDAAIAERPPYILEQLNAPSVIGNPPDGYEQVFHGETMRLFRRKM